MRQINYNTIFICAMALLFSSCSSENHRFDATGSFEADETIISAEANGRIRALSVEEGQILAIDQYLGYIDTTQLFLTKKQLKAQIAAVRSRKPDIPTQLSALNEQLKASEKERIRIQNLLKSDAATTKQLDDIVAQIDLINGNIKVLKNTLSNSANSVEMEIGPLEAQIQQIEDQISKSLVVNPTRGTVLAVYPETHEQIANGQPLYRIADLEELTLKAYISGDQFAQVKLNQEVRVFTDDGSGGFKESKGVVYWISEKAEFTPKTVQTKNERANKVYAIKIKVKNDGTYKIGMYGEVTFD